MKRADSQKSKTSVVVPPALLKVEPSDLKQVYPDSNNRRVCTSAAMIGLAAMSLGLPNLLLPENQQAARAAEPIALDPNQTTDKAVSKPNSSITLSLTQTDLGANSSDASLGNRPVVEPTALLSPEPRNGLDIEKNTSQSPVETPVESPVAIVENSHLTANTEVLTQAEEKSEETISTSEVPVEKQAALDEAVGYAAVLEYSDANPSQTLTVLPSGKTAPQLQPIPVADQEQSESLSKIQVTETESVVPQLPESQSTEPLIPVKPQWEQANVDSDSKGLTQFTLNQTLSQPVLSPSTQVPEKVTLGVYQVQSGDTVQTIAETQGVDKSALITANQINDPDEIEVNQSLVVPRFEFDSSSTERLKPSLAWQGANQLQSLDRFDGQPKLLANTPSTSYQVLDEGQTAAQPSGVVVDLDKTTAQTKEQIKENLDLGSGVTSTESERSNLPIASSLNSTSVASTFDANNSPFPQPQLHQVRNGETLDAIARRYGVTRTELIQVNQITNPNLIRVNQNLKIPGTEQVQSSPAISLIRGINSTEISSATVGSTQSIPLVNLNQPSPKPQETSSTQVSLNVGQESGGTYSSYVEGLTSEIDRLRQQYQSQPESFNLQPSIPSSTLQTVERVNPEFTPSTASANLEEELQQLQQKYRSSSPTSNQPAQPTRPQTVAVAPLGPDAYDPSRLPIGEMVSPDVPPLAPGERYLPGDRMNGYTWPSKGVLTSGYGWRWGRMHKGIDIAGPIGTPIFAAASGVVDYADWNAGGYGNLVDIRHPDGSLTRYAHNNRLLVRKGQRVRQGQQIAEMGSTGYSTGPHLHFEIHAPAQGAVNPMAYLPNR